MGEELELIDVNGNRVKVSLHSTIDRLTEALRDRMPYECSTGRSGEWIKMRLISRLEAAR